MKHRHPLIIQWLAVAGLFFFILFVLYHEQIVRYQYKPTHVAPANWIDRQLTGEIVAGFVLEQPLALTQTDLPPRERKHVFCIGLLMSNYLNRRNHGEFTVALSAGGRAQVKALRARDVRDNALQMVCFDEFRLIDVLGQDARLTLMGLDGRPGRSVTGWLSPQPGLPSAIRGGEPAGAALVFDTFVRANSAPFQHNAYALMIIASLVLSLMAVASRAGPRTAR